MLPVNDADRTLAAATTDGAASNGAPTLRDRVRSLRLSEKSAGGKGASLPMLLLPWGLCLILGGVAAAFGYYAYAVAPSRVAAGAQADNQGRSGTKDGAAAGVTTDVASSGDVVLEAKGYIIPVHQIQVSPKVAGMLVDVDPRLEEGQVFHEGDILARIEELPYQKDFAHAEKAYASAQKHKEQAIANLASGNATLEGKRDAFTRNRNAPSGVAVSDIVQSSADFTAQEAAVKALEAAIRAAQADEDTAKADLDKAQWNLDNCLIRAPVTGTVLKKSAEKGNIVNPIAFNISASLCDMADLSQLEVDLKIQERDIPRVKKGQDCLAMPEAYANDPDFLKVHPKGYIGKVSRLMPTADRGQGAIPVRVKLDIPKEEEGVYLKPDMGIIVEFLKKKD
ncbi:MAG TPA: efflux RND transporter periplasmic adaptor subunit [Gemmataceae bacterium]|nr:efflux RND transporter periplasmic adaptor subunit [Gemmataceae bacterium]